MRPYATAALSPFIPAGIASSGREQVVANPGKVHRYASTEDADRTRKLRDEMRVIEDEVAALEAALRALPVRQSGTLAAGGSAPLRASAATSHQDASVQAALHDLMGRLQKLQVEAVGPGELEPAAAVALPPPRSSQATRPARPASASGTSHRPRSAPYHATVDSPDDASVASWSADAFGRTRNPGWYHLHRKELYAQRARLKRAAPKGCFISCQKYADEAVRIADTGRLAF